MHTNRFPMILLIPLCLTFLFILATSDALSTSRSVTLTILHTNDTYGRLLPFSIADTKFGGVLNRAHLIRQVREEKPNGVIVLSEAGPEIESGIGSDAQRPYRVPIGRGLPQH